MFHSIIWHVWWRRIGKVTFLFNFHWTRRHVWLNSTKIRRHICWSFTEQRPCNATSSSYPTSLTLHAFNNVVLNQHTCLLMRLGTSSLAASYIAPAIIHVTIEPNLQECWLLLRRISGHVYYIWPVCMSVLLSPNQMPRHHCHRLSRHIYHYACFIM